MWEERAAVASEERLKWVLGMGLQVQVGLELEEELELEKLLLLSQEER